MTNTRRCMAVLLMVFGFGLFLPGGVSNRRASASTLKIQVMVRSTTQLTWKEVALSRVAPGPVTYMPNFFVDNGKPQAMILVTGSAAEVAANMPLASSSIQMTTTAGSLQYMSLLAASQGQYINNLRYASLLYAQSQTQSLTMQIIRDLIASAKTSSGNSYGAASKPPQ